MLKLHVFCIPGLGLSSQFFKNLKLAYGEVTHLDWIEPKGWETISAYARRISEPLDDLKEEIVLIGHSFGGVVAQEIAAQKSVKHLILISSMGNPKEAPRRLKLLGKYGLHRLISRKVILFSFPFWARTHSFRTSALRALFRDSVRSLSSHYFRWSLFRIATWSGVRELETPVFRVHGTRDVTFRIKKIDHIDHVIPEGDHNMVYLKGEEISMVVNEHLRVISASKTSF